MTKKQIKILDTALELFAHQGFEKTSTREISEKAEVSEGLVFKHFKSKRGLLDALADQVSDKISEMIAPLLKIEEPKRLIEQVISLPFSVPKSEYDFWRLQFSLKWNPDYRNPDKMKPLVEKLEIAFMELNHINAQREAELLIGIIDYVSIGLLRDEIDKPEEMKEFLLQKYTI